MCFKKGNRLLALLIHFLLEPQYEKTCILKLEKNNLTRSVIILCMLIFSMLSKPNCDFLKKKLNNMLSLREFLKSIQFKLMKYFIVHNKSGVFKKNISRPRHPQEYVRKEFHWSIISNNSIQWNHKSTLSIVNTNIHHRLEIPVASVNVFFKILQTCLWCIGRWKNLDFTAHHMYSQLV